MHSNATINANMLHANIACGSIWRKPRGEGRKKILLAVHPSLSGGPFWHTDSGCPQLFFVLLAVLPAFWPLSSPNPSKRTFLPAVLCLVGCAPFSLWWSVCVHLGVTHCIGLLGVSDLGLSVFKRVATLIWSNHLQL